MVMEETVAWVPSLYIPGKYSESVIEFKFLEVP